MWNLSCLTILVVVVVVFSSSLQTLDSLNNFLYTLKAKYIKLECEQSTEFLTLPFPNVGLPMMKLEKAVISNESFEVPLKFNFHYANRNTNMVMIKPNGFLWLRNGTGDVDFISPVPEIPTEVYHTSDVEYLNEADYFLAKWTNLTTDTNSSNKTVYTVSVIIYSSSEIIIGYEKINGGNSASVQILNYHKLTPANKFVYAGPKLNLTDLASNSIVYVEQCVATKSDETTTKSSPITTVNITTKAATPSPTPSPPLLQQDINVVAVEEEQISTTNLTNSTDSLIPKIQPNYVANDERANALYNEISNAVNTTEILTEVKIINFSFKFNNVSFRTVTIEPKGKILLNGTPKNLVQIEPIPEDGDLIISSFVLKHLADNQQLAILFQNFSVKTEATSSASNIIMIVFNKSGTIEIIYKNLVNRDIKRRTVVMHTSSNMNVTGGSVEGEIDFGRIENGTSVFFGEANPNTNDTVYLSDLQYKFNASMRYLKNDTLLNSYYLIDVDVNPSTYDDGLATITSQFALKFKHRLIRNVYITNRMEIYFDTVHRKLKVVPDAENFTNTDFKYATTLDYTSLTWSNLQTTTDDGVTTIYHLRVLIVPSGQILILFKEIKNGHPRISHTFIPGVVLSDVNSGTIVHITTSEIENISLINKSMRDLRDEVTSNVVAINPPHIAHGHGAELVEQFDLVTLDIPSTDFINSKSCSFDLGFEICGTNGLKTVHVSNTMELAISDNRKLNLLPNAYKFTDTSFKLIKQIDFVSMQWTHLNTENTTFSLRVFIYPDGKAIVLYENVGPSSISNAFLSASDAIELDNGTFVQINVCNIKPILFDDLLSLFPSDVEDCSYNPVAMLDDQKLETYLKLRPDMVVQVPENSSKWVPVQSKFEITFENEIKVQTISVIDSVQLNLPNVATINLVPIDGDKFIIEADFKLSTTDDYISLTWNNLIVKSNGLATRTYEKIRAIIFKTGTILIIYDIIGGNVTNVFLPSTNEIELKRGLVVKIDACTLVNLEVLPPPAKTFADLLAEFNSSTGNSFQLNEPDFNHYLAMSPDSTPPQCTNTNVCVVESKFNIAYGDVIVSSIKITNHIQLFFEAKAVWDLLPPTNDVKRTGVDSFYYTATDEYLSISWQNLTVTENQTYDIRMVIYPNGDVVFLYRMSTINELVRLMGTTITNRGIAKKSVNEIFEYLRLEYLRLEYLRPQFLLAEVKSANQKLDECATLVNDETRTITKALFGIKTDTKLLDAGQITIKMNFKIEHDGKVHQDITVLNRTKFYFDNPQLHHDFMALGDSIKDEMSFSIYYETTSEYTSISLNNVTFSNGMGLQYKLNGRVVIYPTGEIIFGYERITDSEPQKIVVYDTVIEITNGKVILAQVRNCKKLKAIGKSTDEPPHDAALISSANQMYYSYFARLVLAVTLIMFSMNNL